MGKRKSKGNPKKGKSNKHREKNGKFNVSQNEEKSEAEKYEGFNETVSEDNLKEDTSDINADSTKISSETNTTKTANTTETTNTTDTTNTSDINDYCEEIKAKQQELSNKLKNLSEVLTEITLIRDNVNSIRVDTLTELYFTRQVRPLLDALNIICFSTSNMTTAAVNIQKRFLNNYI